MASGPIARPGAANYGPGTGPVAAAYAMPMQIPHVIMQRRMLLEIGQRAERTAAPGGR
jgi:hypothetical protein